MAKYIYQIYRFIITKYYFGNELKKYAIIE
jgi:hypothetical protein